MASSKPSSSFIELLPAKAYIRPDEPEKSKLVNPDSEFPTAGEIQEAMSKRNPSSASLASGVAFNKDGERCPFLPLGIRPAAEETGAS